MRQRAILLNHSYRIPGWMPGILVFILAVFLSCSGTLSGESLPWKESFAAAPGAPWTWIRENPAAHRQGQDGLEIRLEPGGLMGGGKDAKNILARPLPEPATAVSVHLRFAPVEQYEQAGLILYGDDDNYIKLVKEMVDGQPWVVMAVEIQAEIKFLNKLPLPETGDPSEVPVTLSLEVSPEGVKGVFKHGASVEMAGNYPFPLDPRPRVGIFTQGGRENAERWARFADFTIDKAYLKTAP
ncbi:MAG: DUF1349 domain-containing protein [bacterium]